MRDLGRLCAKQWLIKHYKRLGTECSVNIARDYLDDLRMPVERATSAPKRTQDILLLSPDPGKG
ncbi:hypothetical protein [Polaromonas sp.]|uniref:hypothetical protein n=1 Tax=Polaromonas sp. TaxID=1869339 RepID=UPI003BB80DB5